ncbi:60S ribosomal protein L18a [Astathelohania contejeani]|uniref:60S ribosomal protein L18a n=1 Tax=Astathelohania contejeani TaxID=164912 RepID=A0ABQ7HVI6_9MICR|nr:60S ribosomal protein L18a [Thelohania contejeani]
MVLDITECKEDNEAMKIKNYGIKFFYHSKRGTHNMYKEFRAISRVDAVQMLFSDMGSRYKVGSDSIFVIEIKELASDELIRTRVQEFAAEDVKFPKFFKKVSDTKLFVPVEEEVFN